MSFDVLVPAPSLNVSLLQPVLKSIAQQTGAEIVFKSNCIEMHGMEAQVREAVLIVMELEMIRVSPVDGMSSID